MHEPESTRLKFVLNTWTICNLPSTSIFPCGMNDCEKVEFIREAGYVGLQMEIDDPLLKAGVDAGMHLSATGRMLNVKDADTICKLHRDKGFLLTTLHVGTGFEAHKEGLRLMGAVVEASARHDYPLYVETHRATLTQDPHRTLDFLRAFPGLLLNADLSHWYAGCEMPYGDFREKIDALWPVFVRTRYIHGRMADSSCMQVPVGPLHATNTQHFHEMWMRCFLGFLKRSAPNEAIYFAPELLPNSIVRDGRLVEINYARMKQTPTGPMEESDRWQEGKYLCDMAQKAFEDAQTWYQMKYRAEENENGLASPEPETQDQVSVLFTSAKRDTTARRFKVDSFSSNLED